MYLKRLELSGFKSFATRTTLEFEPGVTAVVGPNGSGKSNIADAIRWVLGAQSKKAVRGKVASDVIFSGTGQKAAMSLAEVSLTFDNTDRKLPYEFAEVVITRRLYRSGDSEYLVNGSPIRLTDLHHALAVAGVGAENYTVISQGMVDRALSQSPKERRGLFEEAAGVRQFYLKRDEARRKLSETSTNLSRVEDVVRELEPRLKTLKRQASAVAQAEETTARLQQAYQAKYGHRYRQWHRELTELDARRAEIDREFLRLTEELKETSGTLAEMRQRQQGLTLNKLLAQRDERRDRREQLQQKLNRAITEREVAATKAASHQAVRDQAVSRLSELPGATVDAEAADPSLAAEIARVTKARDAAEARYRAATQKLSSRPDLNQRDFSAALAEAVGALTKAVAKQAPYAELIRQLAPLKRLVGEAKAWAGEPSAGPDRFAATTKLVEQRDELTKELHDLGLREAALAEGRRLREDQTRRHHQEAVALQEQITSFEAQAAEAVATVTAGTATISDLADQLKKHQQTYAALEKEIVAAQQQGLGDVAALHKLEGTVETKRHTQEAYRQELADSNVAMAKLETKLEALRQEAGSKISGVFPPTPEAALPEPDGEAEALIARLERRLLELGGIDQSVSQEYEEVRERFEFLTGQGDDLRAAQADLDRVIRELERRSRTLFRDSFAAINEQFQRFFTTLFGGGKAALRLVEGEEEDGLGIEISATPPGKRLQNLAMLSGGERALTSVALLFAILKVNPSPFVMLDEVDAALDEANTARFAELVRSLAAQTQFVVVTHNRDTMKAAETLYGVTMDESGISTLLSIKLPEGETVAA